jgi:hypothetical protein
MRYVLTGASALVLAIAGAFLLQFEHRAVPTTVEATGVSPGTIRFFKNYFVTGDYAEGGVGGLRGQGVEGLATGSIGLTGVPEGADILAAFLYWQVTAKAVVGSEPGAAGATFNGYPLTSELGPIAKVLTPSGTPSCFGSAYSYSSSSLYRTYTYRADVLRLFDVDEVGKPIVNGSHQVRIPDGGPESHYGPSALGASLIVVYRDETRPLRAVVLYDGGVTVNSSNGLLTQNVRGFYQPDATPDARLTLLVGSGQYGKKETVTVKGTAYSNPLSGADGAYWDSLTLPVNLGATPQTVSQFSTAINTRYLSPADCLTPAALVFGTDVLDTDADGLLNIWESTTAPLLDPNGQPLPLLSAMGADPNQKDLFVEINYMHTAGNAYEYGGVQKPAHSHLPTHDALKLVGDAFKNAPTGAIRVHFDVGDAYPSGPADEYLIRGAGIARGGEGIDEARTVCDRGEGQPPWICQFSEYPGTVGWKTGFRFIRDEVLSGQPPPADNDEEDVCDLPGSTCERRFDSNRMAMFHYALFAHATGVPKSEFPCLVPQVSESETITLVPGPDVDGVCTYQENPEFRIPRTITGVGDFPGADALITLGAFDDENGLPVGTSFGVGSTFMHEEGHNLSRRHGGEAFEPNCKPTYFSVMNYLYQLRGLLDDTGKPHLNFSSSADPGLQLTETNLFEVSLGALPYRPGWYTPLEGSYMQGRAEAAKRRCDGTDVAPGESMVRIDARTAADVLDWNANGTPGESYELDINYNGQTRRTDASPELLASSDDWSNLKLNQIGARRNIGGRYVTREGELGMGPLSVNTGRGDWGRGDWGRGDWGRGDWGRGDWGLGDLGVGDTGRDAGRGDWGRGDWGRGDWGRGDWGRGDWGRGDWGGGDLFQGIPGLPGGELDFETAQDLAKTPPTEFSACVIGVDCPSAVTPLHAVRLDWKVPTIGAVAEYRIYRVDGPALLPGAVWTLVGTPAAPVPGVPGVIAYTTTDMGSLVDGAQYTYFGVAIYTDGTQSDPSNLVTITATNDAPSVSAIADQTIAMNGTTGPIAFTIADENAATVTMSGASSNTTLVPAANIVFGGAGVNRTVTVTPAANQSGTATIAITATDAGAGSASVSFLLTVNAPPPPALYTFIGFKPPLKTAGTDASPSDSGKFQRGQNIPMKWQLKSGSTYVSDPASLKRIEAVPGTGTACTPSGGPSLVLFDESTGAAPGSSYQYESGEKHFHFNWKTTAASAGTCYRVRLTLADGSAARVTIVRFK